MTIRISGPPRRGRMPRPDRRLLRRRALCLLRELEQGASELSVALLGDAEMADLNERWRGLSGPTDVLSFSLLEGPDPEHRGPLLGDVVIGVERAAQEARGARRSLDDEVARLLVHGLLHLLGFDHERASDARVMRAEERRLLRTLGS